MQDAGANRPDEQKELRAQQSRPGDPTRTFGSLFGHTGVDEYIIDPATQNKLDMRLAGAVQAGAGLAGVAGSGVLCTTGLGCAAGAVTATVSADYAQAGAKQAITGTAAVPYGEQMLQSLGLSPQAAAITYGVLGVVPAAVEGVALNKAVKIETAANIEARLSYEPIRKFAAQGVHVTPQVMQTSQAQAIAREYMAAGVSENFAKDLTADLILTGKALPIPTTVGQGFELVKVVPRTTSGGDVVSSHTPYFVTRQEFDNLSLLSFDQIAQRLGLPAEQGLRGTQLGFDVYAIVPKNGVTPKVFASEVAPIQQGSYVATGGAQQILVPNRSAWTDPVKIGAIAGTRK